MLLEIESSLSLIYTYFSPSRTNKKDARKKIEKRHLLIIPIIVIPFARFIMNLNPCIFSINYVICENHIVPKSWPLMYYEIIVSVVLLIKIVIFGIKVLIEKLEIFHYKFTYS